MKLKFKRRIALFMAMMTCITTLFGTFPTATVNAAASDLTVTASSIKYKDGSSWKELTAGTYLKFGTDIQIDVAWSLPDTSHEASYVTDLGITSLTIPNTGDKDYNSENKKVATYSILDGKFHLNITDNDYQNNKSGRNGGFTMEGTFTGGGSDTPYGTEYSVSVLGKIISVKYDDATSASYMESSKNTDGEIASDGTQKYKISMTARNGAVHGISLKDDSGDGLSDMKNITVEDAGGTDLLASYGDDDFTALNAALANVTLAKDKTITLTYTMQADTTDLYKQTPKKKYGNNVKIEYKNNHNETKTNAWNYAEITVSKPTVSKSGKTSDDGKKITWSIAIYLAGKDSHSSSNESSDQLKSELKSVISDFSDTIPEGCTVTSVSLDDMTASYDSGSKKYMLTYDTDITDEYQKKANKAEIKNTVSYKIGGTSYSAASSAYTIGNSWIEKEVVDNSYNPTDNTVQWKVTLSKVPEGITNVKLQESPDWQQTVQSIKIGNTDIVQDGSFVTGNSIAESYDWGKLTFKDSYITANNSKDIEVLVTTKLNSTPANNSSYTNYAYLSYKPDGTSSEITLQASATWKYKENLTKSGWDNGDGTITYTVTANYKDWCDSTSGLTGTNRTFSISDVYDADLEIVEDSLDYKVVAGWNYNATGSLEASDYNNNVTSHTLTMNYTLTEADVSGILSQSSNVIYDSANFTVTFTYKARPKDTLTFVRGGVAQTYTNSAGGTFGTESLGTVTNQTSLNPAKVISKTMRYDTDATTADERKKVSYTVVVNPDKLDLEADSDTLEITDTLKTTDLVYNDLSTVKVKVNGTESNDYTVKYGTDNNQLIFTVPDSAKVEVTYSAKIKDRVYNTNNDVNTSNQVAINALGALSGATSTSGSLSNVRLSDYIRSNSYSLNLFKCSETETLTALSGAEFSLNRMIYDAATSSMNVDSSFTQRTIKITAADGISAIENLTSNELYMLKETKAPAGYAIDEAPYYFIYYNGEKTPTTYSGYTVHEFEDKGTLQFGNIEAASLKLVKTVTGGTNLASVKNNLTFNIKDEAGTTVRTVLGTQLDENGSYTIDDLKPGNYTVEEVIAATGTEPKKVSYQIGDNASAEGKTTSQLTLTAKETTTVTYTNQYDGEELLVTEVKISKKAVNGTDELPGATLTLYQKSGSTWTTKTEWQWKSTATEKTLSLNDGEYKLEETTAPNGYTKTENIEFSITSGVLSGTDAGVDETNKRITMRDKSFTVNVNKTDLGGTELAGATIKIYKESDVNADGSVKTGVTELASWVSVAGEKHDFGKVLQAGQTYTLVETGAPDGYAYSENITFKVNADGTIQAVEDKIDANSVVTSGATADDVVNNTITMKDAAKKSNDDRNDDHKDDTTSKTETDTSNEKASDATDEKVSDATDEKVSDADGKSTTSVTESETETDNPSIIQIMISKKAVNGSDELPGATLTLYQKSGSGWTTKPEWQWISTTTEKTLSLEDGEYKLKETTAPNGYAKTESIEFAITSGVLTGEDAGLDSIGKRITMKDKAFTVNVNKTDLGGNEVAGAIIRIYNESDVNETGNIKEGAEALDSWISVIGEKHDFGKVLQAGQTYVLVETGAPDGYAYSENITFNVNADGTIHAVTEKTDTNAVVTAGATTDDVINNAITMKDAAVISKGDNNDSHKDTVTASKKKTDTASKDTASKDTASKDTVSKDTGSSTVPKTGDDNQLFFWILVLICASVGTGALIWNEKKNR